MQKQKRIEKIQHSNQIIAYPAWVMNNPAQNYYMDYAAIWAKPNSQVALSQKGLIFHFR